MKMQVLGERCLIRPDKLPERTESGLYMPELRHETVSLIGTVVGLGDGPVTKKGVRLPHVVVIGDRVIFSPDSGEEILFERDVLVCMREDDLLAVLDPEQPPPPTSQQDARAKRMAPRTKKRKRR